MIFSSFINFILNENIETIIVYPDIYGHKKNIYIIIIKRIKQASVKLSQRLTRQSPFKVISSHYFLSTVHVGATTVYTFSTMHKVRTPPTALQQRHLRYYCVTFHSAVDYTHSFHDQMKIRIVLFAMNL